MNSIETWQTQEIVSFRKKMLGLLIALRPKEWTKNLLVFSGLIFSGSLSNLQNLRISLLGFIIFCGAGSATYLLNDLCDREEDRKHPVKKNRPLASGMIGAFPARVTMVLLFGGAIFGAIKLNWSFALIIILYLIMNVLYSFKLKEFVVLDVILIAVGFVLRAVAGAVILNVTPSEWLVLCTSMVALLVGFGKRRSELVLLREDAKVSRISLKDYSLEFLNLTINISAGAAIITYALYSRAEETISRTGSYRMMLTIPFVVYGVFRYLFLIHERNEGGDPVRILFHDRATQVNLVLWIISVCAVIYMPSFVLP